MSEENKNQISDDEYQSILSTLSGQTTNDQGIVLNDPKASGAYEAFLSGLSNNEAYRTRFLAERRFPNLVELGIDPTLYYFVDGEGDIVYRDPDTGQIKKEYREAPLGLGDAGDYLTNIGPTGQFLAEVVPGLIGLTIGYGAGGAGGAILGGTNATAVGGTVAYAARAGISNVLGGPPVDVEKARQDLAFSSLTGGIPIGLPTKAFPKALQGIYEKFPGVEGREALQDIVLNGGKSVDEKIAYMAEKYPNITITRAEADSLVGSNAFKIQKWLQTQPRNEKLMQFYDNRAVRIQEISEDFFEKIKSGKYLKNSEDKNILSGKGTPDAEVDLTRIINDTLEEEKIKLQNRVGPMYKDAYDLDVSIDVSDILKDVDQIIADKNTSAVRKNVYKKVKKALTDANTKEARNTTELLHMSLKDDFNRVLSQLSTGNTADGALKREISLIRTKISERLKSANPSYAQATKIYDEALGTSLLLEKSIVGKLAKVVEVGGTNAGRLTNSLFKGSIKPKEIAELKKILQSSEEGIAVWQNLKGTWLSTQWDNALAEGSTNVLGQPNKFLQKIGLTKPSAAFPERNLALTKENIKETVARGDKAKLWKGVLEPEELDNFIDYIDLLQAVSTVQRLGGSDTFFNQAMNDIIKAGARESFGPGTKTVGNVFGPIYGSVEALLGGTVKTVTQGKLPGSTSIDAFRSDAYIDYLIKTIVDPTQRTVARETINRINPHVYYVTQLFANAGKEGVEAMANDIEQRRKDIQTEAENPSFGPLQQDVEGSEDISALQMNMSNFNLPNIDAPAFEMPETNLTETQLASASILPNEKDREIAQRLSGGIASLV